MLTLRDVWPGQQTIAPCTQPSVHICAKTGKIRHARRADALRSMRSLRAEYPEALVNVYRCAHGCRDFHVGRLSE